MKEPWAEVHDRKLDSPDSVSLLYLSPTSNNLGSWKKCQDLAILLVVLTSCLRVISSSRLWYASLMTPGPIGSAAFNNEFGRPCITGYFRTFLATVPVADGSKEVRG